MPLEGPVLGSLRYLSFQGLGVVSDELIPSDRFLEGLEDRFNQINVGGVDAEGNPNASATVADNAAAFKLAKATTDSAPVFIEDGHDLHDRELTHSQQGKDSNAKRIPNRVAEF